MNSTTNMLITIGLATGAVFGISGSAVQDPILTIALYEISSLGLILAFALLALKFFRMNKDFAAAGFLIFLIGEAVMSGGTAAGELAVQPSFGAGIAMYVPALLLIGFSKEFASWVRFTGLAAAIPFAIIAIKIFGGGQVLSSSPLAGIAYGLLVITIIGWIINLNRKSEQVLTPAS